MQTEKAIKLKFGSVTFFLFLGVCVYTHYSFGFCMLKSRQSNRCEGALKKLLVDLLECPAPVVKLD